MNGSERSSWIIMVFMVCLWVIWNGWAGFFLWLTNWGTISDGATLNDFFNLYNEGIWWRSGAYVYPGTHAFNYPFSYPPSSLPLFGFFAQFNFGTAAQLWTSLGLIIFLAAMLSAAAILKPDRKYLFISIAALLFFTSYGVRAELQLGQANLLLAGLTILSLVAHRAKRTRTSATLLAAGTLLKGSPILFLLYFVIFYRDLRYLRYFVESTVALLGISFLVVPIQLYSIWLTTVFPTLFVSAALPINESITGPIALSGLSYFTPELFVFGICMFAAFAYRAHSVSFRKLRGPSPVIADAMFLMNSLVVLLLGTRSWPQDYVWVILPAALFLSALLVEGVKTPYFVVVSLAAFLFNFNVYPLFVHYLDLYPAWVYYIPQVEMVPMGLVGDLLMVSALLLLFIAPQAIFRNRSTRDIVSNRSRRT